MNYTHKQLGSLRPQDNNISWRRGHGNRCFLKATRAVKIYTLLFTWTTWPLRWWTNFQLVWVI